MTLLSTLLFFGAAALGFFLLVDGLSYLATNTGDRGESRRQRRLAGEATVRQDSKIEQIARDDDKRASNAVDSYVDGLLAAAHSSLSRERIYVMMVGFSSIILLALLVLASWLPLALQTLMAFSLGVAIPVVQLKNKAKARIEKFQEQLPDALDLVVRSLRIGHPLSAALQTIASELPAPLGAEFAIASRQVVYGKTPPEAINALASRIDLQDVRFFAVAVQIHHEAGGNLAEILSGLSKIIRSRFQLFRKIKALTVEGRFSAWFLSLFPIVMIFAMNALQPGYYAKVSDFFWFPHLIALTVFLLVVNVVAMRMMTKLEV